MSYHLYHTDGIVLSATDVGESNRYYHIFTKDLGLVIAFAQGVRELKSKFRHHLDVFSYVGLTLVRGRDVWRVIYASRDRKFERSLADADKRLLIVSLSKFLKRFLHGEEEDHKLFAALLEGLLFLENETLSADLLRALEVLLLLRMLESLGYLGKENGLRPFLEAPLARPMLLEAAARRGMLLSKVNRSLTASHL